MAAAGLGDLRAGPRRFAGACAACARPAPASSEATSAALAALQRHVRAARREDRGRRAHRAPRRHWRRTASRRPAVHDQGAQLALVAALSAATRIRVGRTTGENDTLAETASGFEGARVGGLRRRGPDRCSSGTARACAVEIVAAYVRCSAPTKTLVAPPPQQAIATAASVWLALVVLPQR